MADGSVIPTAPEPHEDSQFLRDSHVLGKSAFQKRIDKLTREKYELQAQVHKLEAEIQTKDADIAALEQSILRLDGLLSAYERGDK